jgi:hypothetical protein
MHYNGAGDWLKLIEGIQDNTLMGVSVPSYWTPAVHLNGLGVIKNKLQKLEGRS